MGDWGGDNEPDNQNLMLQESIENNQREIAAKRQEIYERRFDIVKSQGAQRWTAPPITLGEKGVQASGQPGSMKEGVENAWGEVAKKMGSSLKGKA